jgi:phosphoenolpyruvate carboxylase
MNQSYGGLQQFKNNVALKFQLYNSLFTSLPFHRIEKTGLLLSLLLEICSDGYKKKQSPVDIIESFFEKHTDLVKEQEKIDRLFRIVQFVERQVVLFDALEDAAFKEVNDLHGVGTLKHLESEIIQQNAEAQLAEKLRDFKIRLVLTAHPTQFYPGSVLGIINDLAAALSADNTNKVNTYLAQLGKTPFLKKQKPTPYDEAVSLIWFLENIFYTAAGSLLTFLKGQFPEVDEDINCIFQMGFWPGGDRDGNPNVRVDTTLQVANALRESIIKCYYLDVRRLKRRLTFKGVDTLTAELEKQLYDSIYEPCQPASLSKDWILQQLKQIRDVIIYQHNGLFLNLVDNLINKVHVFGLHFASLDVRQESTVHTNILELIAEKDNVLPKNYAELSDEQKINVLTSIDEVANVELFEPGVERDTLETIAAIRNIQESNGMEGCHRYVISQNDSALNVIEVLGLFLLGGWKKEEINIDIVPLFETITDLKNASAVMKILYENDVYREHLKHRRNIQTIMLGFSDGTKDGGYFMANWSIFKAKQELTRLTKEYGLQVVFFDGRGGPPGRGGGKSHRFYASMGKDIANKEIHLTIQGQTVSSNFGTVDAAKFNIEQLLHAGITNQLFSTKERTLKESEEKLLQELADASLVSYTELKNNPEFFNYLANISPLRFFSDTNIGSRPAKRGGGKLTIKDLRAIPFVGSWSQIKQNVPGFYGLGTALQTLDKLGRFEELKEIYKTSLFFKTLIDNSEMAMIKSYFPLTAFLSNHSLYGELWNKVYEEYLLTEKYVLKLSGNGELMADYPIEQLSIQMREKIVLPLTTIQQFAMARIRELEERNAPDGAKEIYKKLVIRCSFGIINAGRNSA